MADAFLLEDGDFLLLESGDNLLLEGFPEIPELPSAGRFVTVMPDRRIVTVYPTGTGTE